MPPVPSHPQPLGPLLARFRLARGWSQARLAAALCTASGVPTLSRHEVSRWERQLRVPGAFWLGWLAVVLAVPVDVLARAAAHTRRLGSAPAGRSRSRAALLALAGRWLADPRAPLLGAPPPLPELTDPPPSLAEPPSAPTTGSRPCPAGRPDATGLAELRRLDDLCGGADLVGLGAYRMGLAARALAGRGPAARRRLLPVLAESAQLAGWLAADAGNAPGALAAYRLALRAAATAGDPTLGGYVLGSASHLLTDAGDPDGGLVLARTAYAGTRRWATPGLRAVLLHRIALAAAVGGRVTTARQALAAARDLTGGPEPDREPAWLYWLDGAELAAMSGRTLVAMGRPGPAEPLLRAARQPGRPRRSAIYGGWLARGYLHLGEVEQACAVAAVALVDAVRAGSPRAVRQLTQVRRRLDGHADVPEARRYRALAAAADPWLPRPVTPGPAGRGPARPTARRAPTGTSRVGPTG